MSEWTPTQLAEADQTAAWSRSTVDRALIAVASDSAGSSAGLTRVQRVVSLTWAVGGSRLDRASLCAALAEALLRLHETGTAVGLRGSAAAVNDTRVAGNHLPGACSAATPARSTGRGPCPTCRWPDGFHDPDTHGAVVIPADKLHPRGWQREGAQR